MQFYTSRKGKIKMGANQRKQIRIFLGNQPRLLREMLELALSQLLDNAVVRSIDIRQVDLKNLVPAASNNGDVGKETSTQPWIVLTAQEQPAHQKAQSDNKAARQNAPDPQAAALLAQQPNLQIAMLGDDARTLRIFTAQSGGDVKQKTYTDFSLSQLVEVFQGAA
jgi:hypothetical protein